MAPHLYAFYEQEYFSGQLLDNPAGTKQDLPRNRQGRALIADPRNTENVARALGKPVTLPNTSALRKLGLRATPLLYYVLAEAEHQYQQSDEDRLGPVGGQLLTDAVIRLLRADPESYLNAHPNFRPASEFTNDDGVFGIGQLVTGKGE